LGGRGGGYLRVNVVVGWEMESDGECLDQDGETRRVWKGFGRDAAGLAGGKWNVSGEAGEKAEEERRGRMGKTRAPMGVSGKFLLKFC